MLNYIHNNIHIIHPVAVSSERVIWSESGVKSAQMKQCSQAKTALN